MAVVVVPNEHFRWSAGQDQIAAWTRPDSAWETWFCRICGSRVPGRNDDARMFVPAGLLGAEADRLTVLHHLFVNSKAGWDIIGDGGQQHAERITPSRTERVAQAGPGEHIEGTPGVQAEGDQGVSTGPGKPGEHGG
jgi:hypothetical protein